MKDYRFGNYICALRTRAGLSQFQLGTLVGVTDKAVSKWENGDAKPRVSICHRLAEVLGVTVNELLSCNQSSLQARKETSMTDIWLWKQAYNRLHSIYGKNPPLRCLNRLIAEETVLKDSKAMPNYAILASIQNLAQKHNTWIVVDWPINSFFTAWLLGATEVNPLPPHYYCPRCGKTEFSDSVKSGFDLPAKTCSCGTEMKRDGHNIPFESYISSNQNGIQLPIKVSTQFLPHAVKIMKDFYSDIATVIQLVPDEDDDTYVERYVIATDKKRTPHFIGSCWNTTINEFFEWYDVDPEPIFAFSVSDDLNRLEALAAKTITASPSLEDLLNSALLELVYKKYSISYPLLPQSINEGNIPAFEMLLKICGFKNARNAWEENGEVLVRDGTAQLRQIPCVREDIWHDIMSRMTARSISEHGLAQKVMETARKGQYTIRGIPNDIEAALQELDMPEWYTSYLSRVFYLDSKGRCLAQMLNDLLLTWYEKIMCEHQ